MNWPLIFLASVIIIGCLVGIVVLLDVLAYMNLQRRLREERERKRTWGRINKIFTTQKVNKSQQQRKINKMVDI